jgi:hypothetical protein
VTRSTTAIVAGLVAAAAACAAADGARRKYLRQELDAVRYEQPIDEAWHEVQRLLSERGYPLSGKDAEAVGQSSSFLFRLLSPAKETRDDGRGGRFLETGWKNGVRYRVDGTADGPGCRVVFTAIEEDMTEHGRDASRHRDLDLELELARRLAPQAAARIERGLPDGMASGARH